MCRRGVKMICLHALPLAFALFWTHALHSVDAGEWSFPANMEASRSYFLVNSTGRTMRILGIRASCSCVGAECGKLELQPGESTELTVTLEANSQSGDFSHSVYVETDSPGRRFIKIMAEGRAIPLLDVSPAPRRCLGVLRAGGMHEFRHELVPSEPGDRISLELVHPALPPGADIRLERQDGRFQLTAVITPRSGQDRVRVDFSVRVVEPEGWPDIRFSLTGTVQDSPPTAHPPASGALHGK